MSNAEYVEIEHCARQLAALLQAIESKMHDLNDRAELQSAHCLMTLALPLSATLAVGLQKHSVPG